MNDFKQRGKTIILVSHDLATVRHFCSRVALLDHGKLLAQGTPDSILDKYLEMVHQDNSSIEAERAPESSGVRWGSGEVKAQSLYFYNSKGEETAIFDTNESIEIEGTFRVNQPVKGAVFGYLIYRSDGTYVHGSNHFWHKQAMTVDLDDAGEILRVRCQFPSLPLLPGQYYVTITCYNQFDGFPQAIDHWERVRFFSISKKVTEQHGLFYLDNHWSIERNQDCTEMTQAEHHDQ